MRSTTRRSKANSSAMSRRHRRNDAELHHRDLDQQLSDSQFPTSRRNSPPSASAISIPRSSTKTRSSAAITMWWHSEPTARLDTQLSFFSRYSNLHFIPDTVGDLVFNGVASDVIAPAFSTAMQSDNAYHLGPHTMRFGFTVSARRRHRYQSSMVEPLDASGTPIDAPFTIPTRAPSSAGSVPSMRRTNGRSTASGR